MKTKNLFTLFTLFALFGTLFTSCVYNPNTKERIEENLEETLIEEKSYSTEEIEYIRIDCIYEDIEINTTEKSEIFVQLMSNNPSKIPEIKIENNTFSVTSKVKNEIHPLSCTVYISLPKDFNQKNIKIKNISGEITIKDCTSENMYLSTISGSINTENQNCNNFKVETVSGSIKGKTINCTGFSAKSTSGSINLEIENQILLDSTIDTVSGSVKLTVPKDMNFNLCIDSLTGTFKDNINNNTYNLNDEQNITYNDGDVKIQIETISGNIELN